MKKLSAILLIFNIIFQLQAQQNNTSGSVVGRVFDVKNDKPIAFATVTLKGTSIGTTTDETGTFKLSNLKKGKYVLLISYIGYNAFEIDDINVLPGKNVEVGDVRLKEETISLDEVTVTPGSFSMMGNANLSRQTLSSKDIKNMSWAEDITRAVARLPGISSSDYSSKFTIRGGEEDEVLISLDGMELYEPFHQRDYSGGLFSIVDIEAIQGVELMTGGYSSKYGNRMSGVFNMQTKHLADDEKHSSVGLSVMNGRVYTDGKFNKNKGSYIFSARRSMLDLLFRAAGQTESLPSFYDAMGKVQYQLNSKHSLSFHILQSWDKLEIADIADGNYDKNHSKYSNTYSWLTLNSSYNPNLSSRTIVYSGLVSHDRFGSFHKYEPADKGDFTLNDKRKYDYLGLKQDWNIHVSENLIFNTGFDVRQEWADFDYTMNIAELRADSNEVLYDYNQSTDVNKKVDGQMVSAYVNLRLKLLSKLIFEPGVRYDYCSYTGDNKVSPRIALAYAFDRNTFLRAAWGYYYQSQFMNNLEVNNGITSFNPAELAKQYVIGFEHLFNNGINFRFEAYYKDYQNLSPKWQNLRDHLEIFPEQRNDYVKVEYNGAITKGIEFFIKYDQGKKFSYWLSYSLAKADDDVKQIDYNGMLIKKTGWTPRLNDQRHTIYVDVNYRPNDLWTFNLSWNYYKGWPRTGYTYHYQVLPNGNYHFYPVHEEFNATLYPAYHRMDVRANRIFNLKNDTKLTAFINLVNVYNHKNLKKFDLDCTNDNGDLSIDNNGNYVPVRDDKYWLGLIPVIGASWEF